MKCTLCMQSVIKIGQGGPVRSYRPGTTTHKRSLLLGYFSKCKVERSKNQCKRFQDQIILKAFNVFLCKISNFSFSLRGYFLLKSLSIICHDEQRPHAKSQPPSFKTVDLYGPARKERQLCGCLKASTYWQVFNRRSHQSLFFKSLVDFFYVPKNVRT